MKFTKWGYGRNKPITEDDLVEAVVANFTDPDCGGMVEDLQAKVDALTAVVSAMFARLPPAAQRDIAMRFCWDVAEDGGE